MAGGRGTAEIEAALADLRAGRETPDPPGPTPGAPRGTVEPVGPPGSPVPPGAVTLDGVLGGQATGVPETNPTASRAQQEDLERQRSAIEQVARQGYVAEHMPEVLPRDGIAPDKRPDARVGGEIFDVYAPRSNNLRTVRNTIRDKVSDEQAFRVLVDLGRTSLTPQDIADRLAQDPVTNLREVLVIDREGNVTRVFIAPPPAPTTADP